MMCKLIDGRLSCTYVDVDRNEEKNKRAVDARTNRIEKSRERAIADPKEM